MQIPIILAAAAGASDTAYYPYFLGWLAIVIAVVAIFRVSALKREMSRSAAVPPHAVPAHPEKAPPPARPAATEVIPLEIVAVIAAAVSTITGASRRVIFIKPMSTSWERAGRQSVLTSHRIR